MGLTQRLQRVELSARATAGAGRVPDDPVDALRALGLQPEPWQAGVLASTARRQLLAVTRQGGKSTVAAVKATHRTLTKTGALVIILSPSLRQSSEVFRKCLEVYNALGQPVPAASETKLTLELANGGRILSLPGSERTVRGFSAPDLILIDEAAKVEDALLYAILPMMAANPEAQLLGMTTPFGRRGWFSEVWHGGGADWERHKVTVHEISHITAEEVATFRRIMPDWWFRSEFECEFLDSISQVFPTDLILAAASDEVRPLFPDDAPDLSDAIGAADELDELAALFAEVR